MSAAPAQVATATTRFVIGRLLIALIGCVLLLAAASKLWDLQAFANAVERWRVVPGALIGTVAAGLPSLELLLGTCCIVTQARWAALGALALFAALLIGWWMVYFKGAAPECACFGVLDQWVRARAGLPYDLFKSGVLALVALVGSALVNPRTPHAPQPPMKPAHGGAAFTLLELLVCVAVLSVLLAILVPSLGGVRDRSRQARTLGNLRQHGVAITGYAMDGQGQLPAIGTPASPSMTFAPTGELIRVPNFLAGVHEWRYPLLNAGFYPGLGPNDEVFYDATEFAERSGYGTRTSLIGRVSFVQSCATLAQPEYWSSSTRTDRQQWAAMRLADIVFPSRKTMLLNLAPFDRLSARFKTWPPVPATLPVSWLLADGSGETLPFSQVRPGLITGDGPAPLLHPTDMMAGLHTIDGIRGLDK